jgi:branched-chain amino acid transport system substrate-binding protein
MLYNNKKIAFSLYIITLALIGPLIFWLSSYQRQSSVNRTKQISSGNSSASHFTSLKNNRISLGNRVLIKADLTINKQIAAQAFASGDYATAIAEFDSSLQTKRNDPETLIYRNNANAIASGNTVKIATSVPIGGNLNIAKEILRGVAQAQNEVNQNGGIGGKLLQVEIANDDNNPELAKQIASELVNDPKMIAVIGHNSSEATMAAAPVYQQGGLTMISPTSIDPNLSGIGRYIFRTTPTPRNNADILANYMVNYARKTRVAICSASKVRASNSFQEEFSWAVFQYGGKVVNTACDFSDPNFNPNDIPSQAISDGADALLLAPSLNDINQAIETIQANKKRLPLLGNQTLYVFDTLDESRADASGMVLSVVWHPDTIPDKSFPIEAHKLWGGSPSWRTAMAYDSTKAIIAGLRSGFSREQLQRSLATPDFSVNGATGKIEFLPSGDRNLQGILIEVQPGDKSGTGYDFVPFKN